MIVTEVALAGGQRRTSDRTCGPGPIRRASESSHTASLIELAFPTSLTIQRNTKVSCLSQNAVGN